MATFLDVSILGNFVTIFTFLLVFVIVFGMLELFKAFGEGHKGLHSIIAIAIAFIVIFSKGVVSVIQTFTPWFTILILVIFFILFAVRMFGATDKDIRDELLKDSTVTTWIIIFTVVILLFSLGSGFGQDSLDRTTTPGQSVASVNETVSGTSTATSSFNQNLYNTLFHPKVLGMLLVMLLAVMAMLFLTGTEGP
ncbi:MAG: hypothetical protein ACP5NV_02725 [Candidatus Woesearchaeota archaeon]